MSSTEFTPGSGVFGGILIGLAALILMAGNGRILGASGIFSGLLNFNFNRNTEWRLIFIASLLIATAVTASFSGMAEQMAFGATPVFTAIGGLFVGVGVFLGHGCTSGHGICGNARFSKRSFMATCVFMAVAVMTVFVIRHVMWR